MYLLPLKGSDVVMSIRWLQTLGPLVCDFRNLTMEFTLGGRRYNVEGQSQTTIYPATVQSMERFLWNPTSGSHLQLFLLGEGKLTHLHEDLFSLLRSFSKIFMEPKGLPTPRSQDHILLILGAPLANVQPYQYPHLKKIK